jgi:GntR family transcriptional regulator of vanillate catabolism
MGVMRRLKRVDEDEDSALTSGDQTARAIRELILEGALEANAPLRQDELARRIGVSRTPLRTALASLARDGLVEYSANRGYRVRTFRFQDVEAAFEVRATLEALACRIAGRRGLDNTTIAALEQAVEKGDAILAAGRLIPEQLGPYRRMNVAFHSAILAAAGNQWVQDFVDRTHDVPMASDRIILWEDYAIIRRSHDDHHRILAALKAGDGARASSIMLEHVTFAGEVLIRHLRSAGCDMRRTSSLLEATFNRQDAATSRETTS